MDGFVWRRHDGLGTACYNGARSTPVIHRSIRSSALVAWVALLSCGAAEADAQTPLPVYSKDDSGRVSIRAIRLAEELRLDGELTEPVYLANAPITEFVQTLPRQGGTPTERTEAWVMFDSTTLYVAARCYDSVPPEQWVANEMRRDTNQLRQNDHFGVMLDTFHDRRNGFVMYANPLGARADQALSNEGNPNPDWNPVWNVRTKIFDGGWTMEMAVPFKSLRYISGPSQTWGLQMRRAIRHKNEWAHLTPLPLAMGGPQGVFRISAAADLVGLDLPPATRNMELKPYAISKLTTDRVRNPAILNDLEPDAGVDFKFGVTANLTADFTYNTDFAQVEVDEQQVNLTRFNLIFPEKREFFLEGRGLFDFARGPQTGSGGGAGPSTTSVTPTFFYSRRIGLNRGREVPINVGARLTGKAGRFGLGLMNIQTGEDEVSTSPSTNFTVLRVTRDILRRSSIGAMYSRRSVTAAGTGSNDAYGADANFSFGPNVSLGGYYAKTNTTNLVGDDDSYQARYEYAHDRYGMRAEYLKVGDNFNPEVGFLRRDNFKRSYGSLRFSPRPRRIRSLRKLTWEGGFEYFVNGAGFVESKQQSGTFNVELENSDQLTLDVNNSYEHLVRPFTVATGVILPPGGYGFADATLSYSMGQQRRVSGRLSLQRGEFYNGTITAYGFSGARVGVTNQLSVEPTVSVNRVETPNGDFTTTLLRSRVDFAFTPRMFASGLLQYNSGDRSFSTNLRFRWEYILGSEFFAVYTDERDTLGRGFPSLKNRALVFKLNRLFRF